MATRANVLVGVASVSIGGVAIGYTSDGVTMTVSSEFFDVKVEERIGTVRRILTDLGIVVTLNMAEGTLANFARAIPGSSLSASTLTLGAGLLQTTPLVLVGRNPAGFNRTITLNSVNPTGEVSIPYKKGEISIVPVTFSALMADDGTYGTIVDATT
ncbi:MAG: hypothetical protein DDT33_01727 [Firmicutes bacterium]|nr:hypothetical protein [Bacillota bacterium]